MKIIFLLLVLLCMGSVFKTHETITINKLLQFETRSEWVQVYKNQNKSTFQTIYRFNGSDTLKLEAKISIELSNATGKTIRMFSEAKRKPFDQKPGFEIKKVITPSDGLLPIPYAIGYWCTYSTDGNEIRYLIIHAIDKQKTGLSMVFSCDASDFTFLENEWVYIVKNLQFIK